LLVTVNSRLQLIDLSSQLSQLFVVLLLLLCHRQFGLHGLHLQCFDLGAILLNGLLFDVQELAEGHLVFFEFFNLLTGSVFQLLFVFLEQSHRSFQILSK